MTSVDETLFLINHNFSPQQSIIKVPFSDALNLFLAEDLLIPEQPILTRNRIEKTNFAISETLIAKGSLLRPYEMGILLRQGIEEIMVYKPIQARVQPVYSDRYPYKPIIAPLISNIFRNFEGVNISEERVLMANRDETIPRLEALSSQSDIVFFTGYDLDWVMPLLERLGIIFFVKSVTQQPGSSLMIGIKNNKAIFILPPQQPGALLSAELYGRLALAQLLNRKTEPLRATSATIYQNKTQNTHFSIGRYSIFDKEIIVNFRQNVNELTLSDFVNANCYVKILPQTNVKKGQSVEITPFIAKG
ncbi:molybdopterin-binding domain-containing protein [Solitalea koreensis]|uniref:Molybdopterin biosynthesis enzyme n=1 Tax=Solitalea koreensis TaxID=543615 RepID=A0A521AUX3_9SPHI|nr:hypothetical protein [Solitalea koreensis]SMO38626.1 Molybdopterin biosynthesis enzyme [Solitalea koreensis]